MTTSDEQYVPSDEDVRAVWVVHERDCGWKPHPGDPSAEFDRFLARVRRDAAREALDGLAKHFDRMGDGADRADQWAWEWHAEDETRDYRDTNYSDQGDDR